MSRFRLIALLGLLAVLGPISMAGAAELTARKVAAERVPEGCNDRDAIELAARDDDKDIATTIRCVPWGAIYRPQIVSDAKGRMYALAEYFSDYDVVRGEGLLTIFRISSSFREVLTTPLDWAIGRDSWFRYRYEVSHAPSSGLRIEFHGDYHIVPEPGRCCSRVPARKNMTITVDVGD